MLTGKTNQKPRKSGLGTADCINNNINICEFENHF